MLEFKDLLGLRMLSAKDIQLILEMAGTMKQVIDSNNKKTPHLQGKSIITLFYENSTRTRLSFELASKYMGASAANISASSSSAAKGETLLDTVRTIEMMAADVIIIRHPLSGAPHYVAERTNAGIINAGDGTNEHPTQALLDMYTMLEKKGRIQGLKVAITGDILHSRVARSNIWGLSRMGARVCTFGPKTLTPPELESMGATVCASLEEALKDADVIMGLRIQLERQKKGLFPSISEYSRFFGVDDVRLKLAKPDALLMHPGPVNRGVELSSSVIDGEQSFIQEQVKNGVAVRMALLYLMTRRTVAKI